MSFKNYSDELLRFPQLGLSLDLSLMEMRRDWKKSMASQIQKAFNDLQNLEAGNIANPDEGRMVGHYWLRNPSLAPTQELREAIEKPLADLKKFAAAIHSGKIITAKGEKFSKLLIIGIGGSALGPQLMSEAIGENSPLETFFFDNTDPAGMDRVLRKIGSALSQTLCLVISKSGGTPETRNGMLEAKAAYERAGFSFAPHAVAITGDGSKLHAFAQGEGFLKTFPMEDWIGGRTSVLSTVGLVPMALQGIAVDELLEGAAEMDALTRQAENNPALGLASAWYCEGKGHGEKDMVVLPYKDSLSLMSKYLQQLVMESLGKALDLDGKSVHQGIAVYGNKGSTDQHAYIQQLRDGLPNFFATFIEVRKGRTGASMEVEPSVTCADYLQGFLRGTRRALYENGRHSLTLSIPEVTPRSVGHLIALFERAVSFYASFINVNAYHQPGVEAGKKAATLFLELLAKVRSSLSTTPQSAEQIAAAEGLEAEDVYHALIHLSANGQAAHHLHEQPTQDQFVSVK